MDRGTRTASPTTPRSTTCSVWCGNTRSPRPRRRKSARRKRAAAREFQIIQSLDHPNILPVLDFREHELGPALLFRYLDPGSVRFDHWLATHSQKLDTGQRLELLRQIADAIRYAHRKRVIHRSLGPQSILVSETWSSPPRLQVFNWRVGIRESASTSGRVTNVEGLVEAQSLVYMSPGACPIPAR